ncbi:hypothetical protein C7Y71_009765 [Pseudoprevotella muciniphila]|uniref:DUF1566 domain-containing protein n=1 Tax=Pseudoprevotella muciniphila TaxID=2133944 RepID=A0A5P8E8J9_9BACT|nr:hypothetical protein [Pseudoprevotella muciniphila]QFQ13268.1 hypothetical protein C7Y71_009765 [Pseudoprevotella muciniphila]
MKKVLFFLVIFSLIISCSHDDADDVVPNNEEQKEQIDKVIEGLDELLGQGKKVPYEQIQSYLSKYSGVTTYVEDGLLNITTEEGMSFIIDNDAICSLKESSDTLDENYEDIATLIDEIENDLFPKQESLNAVSASSYPKHINKTMNANAVAASSSSSQNIRFLKKKKILIWSPWELNDKYAQRIEASCNSYNARNSKKIQCVYKKGAAECTLQSMNQFSNYDIVVPICHGTPKGFIELPMIKNTKEDGTKEDDIDAQKRYAKAGYEIVKTYNEKTKRYEYSIKPSEEMLKKNLPASLEHTIMWTAICFAGKSSNSVLKKVCEDKKVAAFYGADKETSGNFATSVLRNFIPKFYYGGTARAVIYDILKAYSSKYSEVVDVDFNLKKYIGGTYHLENSNQYEIAHIILKTLRANPNPGGSIVAPKNINSQSSRSPSNSLLKESMSGNQEVGLCFTNQSTGKITNIPFVQSNIVNYNINNSTLSSCYNVECKTDVLEAGTYKYKTYLIIDGETTYATEEYEYIKDNSLCPNNNHPHAIDMGAAGVWACCNVGASKPEDYGGYYAWGETRTNDVACQKWGGSWRMPSKEQLENLVDNCTYKWTQVNNVYGQMFTASNGNRIFLPAAGYRDGASLYYAGSCGYYWSRTLISDGLAVGAYTLDFGSDCFDLDDRFYDDCDGLSVRPVRP